MNSYADMLRRKIRSGVSLQAHTLQQMTQGTSATEVFILHDVLKVGPSSLIEQEYRIYNNFEQILGTASYQSIFPRVSLLNGELDNTAVLEVEWLGELLHDFLASMHSPRNPQQHKQDALETQLDLVTTVTEHCLTHLETLFTTTQASNPQLAHIFLEEMLATLHVNLARADQLASETQQFLGNIAEQYAEVLLENTPVSLCHRDLATDNIYFQASDDLEHVSVKFADPRHSLPFLSSTDTIDHGVTPMAGWGIAAIDLAALWISLYREEQELRHVASSLSLSAYKRVQHSVEQCYAHKRFSRAFFALSLACCTSLYVSCKCDYCTSPQRNWLYEQMVALSHEQLQVCAHLLKGI